MTSRSRLSLLWAGLATVWFLGWIAVGFEHLGVNVAGCTIGVISAGAAIWLAWHSDLPSPQDGEVILDRTFTSS
jgi:hypothetical protein